MISQPVHRRSAFTFVEAVFTIAIIGIMAALAVSAISNASRDANRIVARQQQAAVQEALLAWVLSQTRVSSTAQVQTINTIRLDYNKNTQTNKARFDKLRPDAANPDPAARAGFLDVTTVQHFDDNTVGTDRIKSAAMIGSKQYLKFPDWTEGDMPRVELVDE